MKFPFRYLLALLLCGSWRLVSAQSATSAQEIVQQAIQASGGAAALQAFRQVEWQGQYVEYFAGNQAPPFTLQTSWQLYLPEQATLEYREPGESASAKEKVVINARRGYRMDAGQRSEVSDQQTAQLQQELYWYWLATLVPLTQPGVSLELRPAPSPAEQGLTVHMMKRAPVALYFDRYTHLLNRAEQLEPLAGDPEAGLATLIFSSYQKANGCLRPFHVQLRRGEELVHDLRIHRLENKGKVTLNTNEFRYKPRPLNVQVDSSFVRGTMQVERIVYADDSATRVSAWRVLPPLRDDRPGGAILYIGGKREFLEEVLTLNSRPGVRPFTALLIEAPFANPRQDQVEEAQKVYRGGILAALRGIDLLKAQPGVDGSRILVVGHGAGAQVAGVVAGLRPQNVLSAVLLAGPASLTRYAEETDQPVWKKLRETDPIAFRQLLLELEPLNADNFLASSNAHVLFQYPRSEAAGQVEREAARYQAAWPHYPGRKVKMERYDTDPLLQKGAGVEAARTDRLLWLPRAVLGRWPAGQ